MAEITVKLKEKEIKLEDAAFSAQHRLKVWPRDLLYKMLKSSKQRLYHPGADKGFAKGTKA